MDRLARGAVRFRLLLLGTIADAKVSRNQRVTLVSLLNIPFVFAFIPPRQIGEELKIRRRYYIQKQRTSAPRSRITPRLGMLPGRYACIVGIAPKSH